jgi:hypothetical protein
VQSTGELSDRLVEDIHGQLAGWDPQDLLMHDWQKTITYFSHFSFLPSTIPNLSLSSAAHPSATCTSHYILPLPPLSYSSTVTSLCNSPLGCSPYPYPYPFPFPFAFVISACCTPPAPPDTPNGAGWVVNGVSTDGRPTRGPCRWLANVEGAVAPWCGLEWRGRPTQSLSRRWLELIVSRGIRGE